MAGETSPRPTRAQHADRKPELVVITGLSGSGKGSVLKALEDLGFYSVDNLPVDLIPKFAELTRDNPSIQATALVVDIREGEGLKRFPGIFATIRESVNAKLVFLEADDEAIVPALQRDPPAAPAGNGQVGGPQRPLGAYQAGAHPRDGRPDHQYLEVHGTRTAGVHRRAVPGTARPIEHRDLRHQFRLPQRRAAGQRPGVRRPVPAESQLHPAVQESDGQAIPAWLVTSGPSRRRWSLFSASPTCWSTYCRITFARARVI